MKSGKELCLSVSGRQLPVEIHRRKGSRHLRMSFGYRNQLRVNVPWQCPEKSVLEFIEQQRPWIEEQLARVPQPKALSIWLAENPKLCASGQYYNLRIERPDTDQKCRYYFTRGSAVELVLDWPKNSGEAELKALVRSLARDALQCRLLHHVRRLGLELPALSVRDQVSRWGSCSSNRRISLNWRLLLLDTRLQDYVILHELAHLAEMNHSRRFWALLDRYDPDRRVHEAELDACTAQIMRVGR